MPYLTNDFLEKIETWHVGLSCQYTHFMSFSSKSEHDTVADLATLKIGNVTLICHPSHSLYTATTLKILDSIHTAIYASGTFIYRSITLFVDYSISFAIHDRQR